MSKNIKFCLGVFTSSFMLFSSLSFAGEIRLGITMRMVSENGQKYGQMMMDEIDIINKSGGINGNKIVATLMNDECKSDKGVANANKLVSQKKVHLLIGSSCSSRSMGVNFIIIWKIIVNNMRDIIYI